ncbi:MAG: hypothetical protein AABZ55_00845 [Bdellovibrionota bacterium]
MKRQKHHQRGYTILFLAGLSLLLTNCKSTDESKVGASCTVPITGTSWVPNVSGVSQTNHDSSVVISKTSTTYPSRPVVGLAQAAPGSVETTVNFSIASDLGVNGSLSLVAEAKNYPSNYSGGAYPVLVSLVDSNSKEWIPLARAGGADCAGAGYFTCSSGTCNFNSSCTLGQPSAFSDRSFWAQQQFAAYDSRADTASVNTFPTCNWAGPGSPTALNPACAFNTSLTVTGFGATASPFFVSGKLPVGSYTAKYVLIATNYSSISGVVTDLKVTVITKQDATVSIGGAIDLNVVLVGSKNVADSRTAKGKLNLDLLFQSMRDLLSQSNSNINIGVITVYEWPCEQGGDSYSTLDWSVLGSLFQTGSGILATPSEGKALNVFLVSSILNGSSGSLPILGLSGGIYGPMINGTPTSGLAFSSSNKIAAFNPGCSLASCPITSQEAAFVDMGATISHEIGHYLGLNHPAESSFDSGGNNNDQDAVFDTPVCTKSTLISGTYYLTISGCLSDTNQYMGSGGASACSASCAGYNSAAGSFCASSIQCQFNHLMWWSSKNFKEGMGTGDGNLLSPQSGQKINYSPFVQ